jgi:hypothetical protein
MKKALRLTIDGAAIGIANEFELQFSPACAAWIVRGKRGKIEISPVTDIAAHLLNKKTEHVFNTALPNFRHFLQLTTDAEKRAWSSATETLKLMRRSFRALSPAKKEFWRNQAKPKFNAALREFLKAVKPLKAALTDKRFKPRSSVSITDKGLVYEKGCDLGKLIVKDG